MAKDRHSQVSRYGPISSRSQATQTLPIPTQPPTQLMSHEVHQFTQLVHHDSAEHVRGDTLVNDSDVEGSGDTVVLNADDDGEHGGVDSGPNDSGNMIRSCKNGLAPPVHRDLPDSDATTEEGDVDNVGYLDMDAESRPSQIDAPSENEGFKTGENEKDHNLGGSILPELQGGHENPTRQETPPAGLMDTNGTNKSPSRPRSISSVRAASLRASGLRAAGRSESLNSAGKEDLKLDSEATVDMMPGISKENLTQRLQGSEAEQCGIKDVCMTKTVELETMQSSPKVTVPFDDASVRSPCMSTSKSTSRSISPSQAFLKQACGLASNVPSEQGNKNVNDSEETIALEANPKSSSDHPENTAAPPEMLTIALKRLRSGTSIVSPKLVDHEVGGSDARAGAEPQGQTGHPVSQKARKLVFDHMETSPTDKCVAGDGNAVSKALNTNHNSVFSKQMTGFRPLAREQQGFLTSGNRAASATLSYVESMEPGEESQLNALNVVDKLVWLDASCMPDDDVTRPVPQEDFVKSHAGTKGLKSLAQAAQMKAVHDKLDVFDWEDSQLDEEENKQAPPNMRGRKRQLEDHKLTVASKKQAISYKQKASSEITGKRTNLDVNKSEVPAVEHSCEDQEVTLPETQKIKPHTLLTARIMKRSKAEPSPLSKGKHSPGLQRGRRKRVSQEKQVNQSIKQPETGQQEAGNVNKSKEQQAAPESRRRAGRKKAIDGSGKEVKVELQNVKDRKEIKLEPVKTYDIDMKLQGNLGLADRTSQDDAAADIWIEAFSSAKSKTPADNGVELIKFKKRSTLHENSQQGVKKYRTVEPETVPREDEHRYTFEQEEFSKEEYRVEPGLKSQENFKKSSIFNAAASAQHQSRRVSTRRSKGGHQSLENQALEEELIDRKATRKQKGRTSRASDASRWKKSTRSIQEEHQDDSATERNMLEKNETERETKTEKGAKPNEEADATVKSRKLSSHGSEIGHVEVHELADKGLEGTMKERGPKTRSRAHEGKSDVASSDGKKINRSGNAASKSTNTQDTGNNKKAGSSLSGAAVQADFDTEKPSTKAGTLRKQASLALQQPSMAAWSGQDLAVASVNNDMEEAPEGRSMRSNRGRETADGSAPDSAKAREEAPAGLSTRRNRGREAADGSASESAKAREEAPAGGAKESKRGREASDASVPDSAKTREDAVSQHGEELMCQIDELSGTLRRTRSSTSKGVFQRNEAFNVVKESRVQDDATTENQASKDQVVKSNAQSSRSSSKENKKAKALKVLEKLSGSNVVDKGRRKKREPGEIRVLFSHSLTDDTVKHQKKILAKLDGQLATSAMECTHFVSNGFVRSQNMLLSMASGKIVATTLWLESCGQAHYFVDEKNYILHDEKKEKELGFSMITSLAAARRKPLFKDVRILICSNTTPEPAALKAIIKSGGGQVMEEGTCLSELTLESDKPPVVIANEKGLDLCYQFLVKGLKVYSEELVLQGVVTQSLDFSRNRLFEVFKQQRGSKRSNTGA